MNEASRYDPYTPAAEALIPLQSAIKIRYGIIHLKVWREVYSPLWQLFSDRTELIRSFMDENT